jgi:hypothetical protein
MALQYKKRTEAEANSMATSGATIPAGDYRFKITGCERQHSKSGNPMLVVKFAVRMPTGEIIPLTEWLLLTDQWDWKLRHLADACGLLAKYDADTLDALDFIGKTGDFTLTHQTNKDSGQVNARVKDYHKKSPPTVEVEPEKKETGSRDTTGSHAEFDDQIPF